MVNWLVEARVCGRWIVIGSVKAMNSGAAFWAAARLWRGAYSQLRVVLD